ncbi:DUF4407 domain-containing protein [Maribacter aurantiacus]|uniref:DUF4407 domain-containing protein n=1 Tax=Maribacter aurantiacus TaxID=1882343 RepID=A0A5R8M5I8_9FLAO|nr:DUF4407 domain-containing protein [Maribacter aurantiacus]TLF44827.1 DUF4407 domain-containing protein [Maribacter aurantiacus]
MPTKRTYYHFWKLAGEDRFLLVNSNSKYQLRFAFSGILIILLFIIALISYQHVFAQIFNIPNLSWILGILFSLIIFNIYRLNLITISGNSNKVGTGYSISILFRIFIVLLLALTVIKPLETVMLKRTLNREIASLKVKEIKKAKGKIMTLFDAQISSNQENLDKIKEQFTSGRIQNGLAKIQLLEAKIQKLIDDKNSELEITEKKIDQSPHLVKGIILLNSKYPWVWLITFFFLIVFFLPIIIKQSVPSSCEYVRLREEVNHKIIVEEYTATKEIYSMLFQKKIGKEIELEERYEDPPFNLLVKSTNLKTGSEADYLKYLNGL